MTGNASCWLTISKFHLTQNIERLWTLFGQVQQPTVLNLNIWLKANTNYDMGCFYRSFFFFCYMLTKNAHAHAEAHMQTHTHTRKQNAINTIAELNYGKHWMDAGCCRGAEEGYKLFYLSCTHFTPGWLSPLARNVHVSWRSFQPSLF